MVNEAPAGSPAPEPHGDVPGRRWTALLLGLLVLAGVGTVWGFTRKSRGHYLADEGSARWVVYPTSFDPQMLPVGDRTTEFRRSFRVDAVPATAVLRARGFRRLTAALNGTVIADTSGADWAQACEADVAPHLLVGDNQLVVRVTNDTAPPALWLVLATDRAVVTSDDTWESSLLGATWRPVRLADAPPVLRPGNPVAGGERTIDGLRSQADVLIGFALLSAALLVACGYLGQRRLLTRTSGLRLFAAGVVVSWLVVFAQNNQFLSSPLGFDARLHLEYVKFVQDRSALPLANQGLEMQQPPVYYILSAAVLSACGVAADGGEACVEVLRWLGFLSGLVELLLIALVLRRLFPGRLVPQAVGVVAATALPIHLYPAHYLSNDLLAGVLGTASVYLALVVFQSPRPGLKLLGGLGACLGAAVLTKLTAAPVAAAVLGVLMVAEAVRSRSAGAVVRNVGVPLAACALVCGWYFVRNYVNFGRPIVGTYEQDIAQWWQDPGYAAFGQLSRFGAALIEPFYAMTQGVPDGLYATLWGDGGWGGEVRSQRPPWRYELMAAGYLLALVPSALAVVGWGSLVGRWVNRPTAEVALILVLPLAAVAAILYQCTSRPYYCHVKAFYALPAVAALCAFIGHGFDVLSRPSKWVRWGLGVLLGTWALTALASFLVGPSAETLAWMGRNKLTAGDVRGAEELARRAVEADARSLEAQLLRARLLLRARRPDEAVAELRRAVEVAPVNSEVGVELAQALALRGQGAQAIEVLEGVVSRTPDDARGYILLAHLRDARRDPRSAALVARDGLRVAPTSPDLHVFLARWLVRAGETEEALRHYRIALRFDPNSLPALVGQAWILAAHEDARFRNGTEAVRLADHALRLTDGRGFQIWRTMAAAVAESGDVRRAEQIAARLLGAAPKNQIGAGEIDRLTRELEAYRAGRALRDAPGTIPDR